MPVTIAAMRGSREKAILQPEYEELMQKQKARPALLASCIFDAFVARPPGPSHG